MSETATPEIVLQPLMQVFTLEFNGAPHILSVKPSGVLLYRVLPHSQTEGVLGAWVVSRGPGSVRVAGMQNSWDFYGIFKLEENGDLGALARNWLHTTLTPEVEQFLALVRQAKPSGWRFMGDDEPHLSFR
jgi:hypothetical protein